MKCPCCGSDVQTRIGVIVDLTSNTIAVEWSAITVKLQPIEAEIAHILATSGRYVAGSYISNQVLGQKDAKVVSGRLKSNISTLRKKIKAIGLKVVNAQALGYRFIWTSVIQPDRR